MSDMAVFQQQSRKGTEDSKHLRQFDIGHADRAKAHCFLVTGVTEKLHARG
jgi:hypothetical protein